MWNAICAATSNAGSWPMGRLSQTKYFLSNFPSTVTVIRRHHPLQGQPLEGLSAGKAHVVVRLADGSSMKFPRRWTDADGATRGEEPGGDSRFCLTGLRELLRLVDALGRRTIPAPDACGEITTPHDSEGDSDAQAAAARIHRSGGLRGALGRLPGAGAKRGDRALCAPAGAEPGRARGQGDVGQAGGVR